MNFIFDPSLVLYLPLYQLDGASFVSKDAHGHLCSVTGALWRPNGRYFDGNDDRLEVPRHASLEPTELTLEIWLKFHESGTTRQTMFSKDKTDHTSPYYSYNFRYQGDVTKLWFGWNDGTDNIGLFDTAGPVPTDKFIHLVATYKSGEQKIYRDTVNTASDTKTGAITYYDTGLIIGDSRNLDGYNLGAIVGEIRIYSRVLTPLEIPHNYLATKWRYR